MLRALWDEFPRDPSTWDVDDQFLWGSGLLISPVVRPGARKRKAYFPGYGGQRWFDISLWLWDDTIREVEHLGWRTLDAPLEIIPLHLRGGLVYPTHAHAGANTDASRAGPWHLVVALDWRGEAHGRLYLDDGEAIATVEEGRYTLVSYRASPGHLSSSVIHRGLSSLTAAGWNPLLASVDILGLTEAPATYYPAVTVNNRTVEYEYEGNRLKLRNLYLMVDEPFWIVYY